MATSLIGLGSNLGDRAATVDAAVLRLSQCAGISVVSRSSEFESEPAGGPTNQGRFINAAVVVDTVLAPRDLLALLQDIETELGRERGVRWDARTIDLDLLLYDDLILDSPTLTIPHPRMSFRRFVLVPACEIAADWVHPVCRRSLGDLLGNIGAPTNYVALVGPPGSGKSWLAQRVVADLNRLGLGEPRLLEVQIAPERLDALYREPTGHAWDVALEFLRERSRLLDAQRWSGAGEWLISDFWFDQSLAYARLWLDESQNSAFQRAWQHEVQSVIVPKLLVVLDASTDQRMAAVARHDQPGARLIGRETIERMKSAINDLLRSADRGPMLRLSDACDLRQRRCVDEVVAAVLALQ